MPLASQARDWGVEADVNAGKRERLREIVSEKSLLVGSELKLASGVTSKFYFDMKLTTLDPEGANLIAELMLEKIDDDVSFVGGLEIGAIPVVLAVSMKSWEQRRTKPIHGFFVRKQLKEHGTRKLIDGVKDPDVLSGLTVVLLDDVTTSGASVMKAVRAAREAGARVDTVVTVVDREEGAEKNLAKEGIILKALLNASEFNILY